MCILQDGWRERERKKTREWQTEKERDILQTILSNVTSVHSDGREGRAVPFEQEGSLDFCGDMERS